MRNYKLTLFILIGIILLNCRKEETPYIPQPDLLYRDFTKNIPRNFEIMNAINEILNTEAQFCENSFKNRKVEFNGENDNLFLNDTEQFTASAHLSVYRQKIRNKDDIFVVKSRCCPMGPCYTSNFFKKQQDGSWKLFDAIPGEVIDYKKNGDTTTIKIHDRALTGLIYLGTWKENNFEPLLSYRSMNIEIPEKFSEKKRELNEEKVFSLLKKSKQYHIDNLAFRITAPKGSTVYILSETEEHYFIMLKASKEEQESILENYKGEREKLIEQIQGFKSKVKSTRDLSKILDKTFYFMGWVDKF